MKKWIVAGASLIAGLLIFIFVTRSKPLPRTLPELAQACLANNAPNWECRVETVRWGRLLSDQLSQVSRDECLAIVRLSNKLGTDIGAVGQGCCQIVPEDDLPTLWCFHPQVPDPPAPRPVLLRGATYYAAP